MDREEGFHLATFESKSFEPLSNVLKSLKSVRTFLGPTIVICVTVAVEEFASFILFECPCDSSHEIYGMAYLLGPAILLLLLGLYWQNKLWRLTTSSCRRSCCSLS